ncbi:MAG: hypothetical protein M3P18_01910, partial [Actinomycetota bacterium]|nr:hypothetical protein [Actinomycetota bacterium]
AFSSAENPVDALPVVLLADRAVVFFAGFRGVFFADFLVVFFAGFFVAIARHLRTWKESQPRNFRGMVTLADGAALGSRGGGRRRRRAAQGR